jgi:hypothetical protein
MQSWELSMLLKWLISVECLTHQDFKVINFSNIANPHWCRKWGPLTVTFSKWFIRWLMKCIETSKITEI